MAVGAGRPASPLQDGAGRPRAAFVRRGSRAAGVDGEKAALALGCAAEGKALRHPPAHVFFGGRLRTNSGEVEPLRERSLGRDRRRRHVDAALHRPVGKVHRAHAAGGAAPARSPRRTRAMQGRAHDAGACGRAAERQAAEHAALRDVAGAVQRAHRMCAADARPGSSPSCSPLRRRNTDRAVRPGALRCSSGLRARLRGEATRAERGPIAPRRAHRPDRRRPTIALGC